MLVEKNGNEVKSTVSVLNPCMPLNYHFYKSILSLREKNPCFLLLHMWLSLHLSRGSLHLDKIKKYLLVQAQDFYSVSSTIDPAFCLPTFAISSNFHYIF